MDALFHKAMIFGDPHFGRSTNSIQANQDNLDFLLWAIDEARSWGAKHCIMLGDWFHNRNTVGIGTMHAALHGMELLNENFIMSWFISGNHDQFYRDRRDITSIEFAKHIPNITVINEPLTVDDVTFLPWLMKQEHKTLDIRSRYTFAHLELAGFLTNSSHMMPDSEHTARADDFQGEVYTGHFHRRQFKRNICYIGNCMPIDFNDSNDAERGMMLLEWGHDPIFKSWPNQPLYRAIKLSELLENVDILKPEMTVRIAVDIPLQFDEAQEMRDGLMTAYGLRKVELIHSRDEVNQEFDEPNVEFHTIDQLVLDGLQSIESSGLSKAKLIEIYTSL